MIEDKETTNNTDKAVNVGVENRYDGGTYYFSSAQDSKAGTACYNIEIDFTLTMMNCTAPTLLAVGGNYTKAHEMTLRTCYNLRSHGELEVQT